MRRYRRHGRIAQPGPVRLPNRRSQGHDLRGVTRRGYDVYNGRSRTSKYIRDIHKKYARMIKEQVGTPLRAAGLTGKTTSVKLPLPRKYIGSEDIEKFDAWVQSLLRWLKLSNYGGPDYENDRIALTAMFLDEEASQWFNDNVDSVSRKKRNWSFKSVITGLYDRFIHDASIQDATTKFYSAKYTTSGGVMGFYHELDRYSSRMIHAPDSYTFKTQLMLGLPASISSPVVNLGVSAETHSTRKILRAARQVEEGIHIKCRYEE